MEIREATWEKRNLGVKTYDFFIGIHETSEEVFPEILACDAEYQVLHIAAGNTEVLLKAQDEGFRFLEMGIEMELPVSRIIFPKMYEQFEPYLSYSIANDEELKDVIEIVRTGAMFKTDKIARDPYFGQEQSGIRYAYWIKDVINQDGTPILVKYKDEIVGFHIVTKDERGTVTGILAGIVPAYENKGLGFAVIYMVLKWTMDVGGKRMITNISSNNPPIMKLYESFGFTLKKDVYILVKHL